MSAAIAIDALSHRYGTRQALDEIALEVRAGEIFALLGPNGGGKTTLFRILSTLIKPQQGFVQVLGFDLRTAVDAVRRRIGVVFQAPSLDRKLTVAENIRHQAALYGLVGSRLQKRLDELLAHFGLRDRARELTERLSGGLRRRVELAKGMIHEPRLLLLDEPSTGLDPGARRDLWQYLQQIRRERQVTILLTTHILEEGDDADRLAILSAGRIVALGAPDALRQSVGGDTITIECTSPQPLAESISRQFSLSARVMDGSVRIETEGGHLWIARLVETFPGQILAVRLGKPTLEDVFIARTGHRFWHETEEASDG
jgi:ABC-2 type transport system ATP-binding protein